MPDWISIAKARGLDIPAAERDRVSKPLDALEQSFRPLVQSLTSEMEPATGFSAEKDAE